MGGSTLIPESGGIGDSEGKGEIDLGRRVNAIKIWDIKKG